jgi:hypothetical protein
MPDIPNDEREENSMNADALLTPQSISNAFLMLSGTASAAEPEGPTADAAWIAHIETVDAELRRGEIGTMLRAWHAACASALGGGTWDAMIASDAALRQSTGFKVAFAAKARQAYHVAFFRAHHQASVEGVRRAGDCFAALGEEELAAQCRVAAERLARSASA